MRMLLLHAAAGIMILVPASTATMLALYPDEDPLFPLTFWVAWLLVSVFAVLDAPQRVKGLVLEIVQERFPLLGCDLQVLM